MTFKELLTLVSSKTPPRICIDSRDVESGDIFIALPGSEFDGHEFIHQAVKNGAEFIIAQKPCKNQSAEQIIVDDSARAAAELAQKSQGNPADRLINLAVTGTNGKTTVAYLVRSIIKQAGKKCGLIGTILYDTGEKKFPAELTTPNCLDIAEKQKQMVAAGSDFMIIEASSHALCQNRLAGIKFQAAAFTNLAGDHLDYHKTKKDYLAAKAKLFRDLEPDAAAVLNKQSSEAHTIAGLTNAKIIWYAVDEPADLTAHINAMDITGTDFTLEYKKERIKVKTPLFGGYNISNCLAAAGLTLAAGFDLNAIRSGLAEIETIPGRLEKIDAENFSVIIDYAHSDDALKNALTTLKPLCKGDLTVVFGCGGDRDKSKRPRMAKVAEKTGNKIIVTSDNPRTEQPDDIIKDIMAGFENPEAGNVFVQPDREKAIKLAIRKAKNNDIVLIAGKGHEDYQILGKEKIHFSDKQIVLEFLNQKQ